MPTLPFLLSGEDAGSLLRTAWARLKDVPPGKQLFSPARLIVAELSIEYAKKARGNITATAACPTIESNARAA